MNKFRVAVVDDHPVYRVGVANVLASAGLEVVAEGASAEDVLAIAREQSPDIIFLDINMRGNGLEAVQAVTRDHPQIRTIVLTSAADEQSVTMCLRAGVVGYLHKAASVGEVVESVRRVTRGECYVCPNLAAKLLMINRETAAASAPVSNGLSPREEQFLICLKQGLSNKEIGRSLQLSEKTIKHYLSGLLTKLRLRNRVEAAIFASTYKPSSACRQIRELADRKIAAIFPCAFLSFPEWDTFALFLFAG
jgi:two-component system nitrate/nitrite response regulator NarL